MNSRRLGRPRAAQPPLRPHSSHKAGDGIAGPLRNGSVSPGPLTRRLRYEPLEDRRLLALVTVDTVLDTVDFNDGKTSLREAIFATNTVPGADEIRFDPALFANGSSTILLTQGELKITDSLTLTGPGAELLAIDASGNDPTPDQNNGDGSRVFNIAGRRTIAQVSITGTTLTGGDVSTDGGAITATSSSLRLDMVHVVANGAQFYGAITWYGALGLDSTLRVSNSQIVENWSAVGASAIMAIGSLSIERSVISHNASQALYPAILAGNYIGETHVSISESQITENVGGGVASYGRHTFVTACTIRDNNARYGGGLWMSEGTLLNLSSSTVSHNTATISGGGIYLSGLAQSLIVDSTLSGNSAIKNGGGIFADNATLEIQRSTVADNHADGDADARNVGGGIRFDSRGTRLTLVHVVIAGNVVGTSTASDVSTRSNSFTARHSLIGSNAGTPLAEAPLGAPDANGNLIGGPLHGPIDPLLAPLADNGGPTLPGGARLLTHALLPGSPALNAGDPASIAGLGDTPEFDQRGAPYSRVVGRIDIGAVEQIPPLLIVDTLADESDGDYHPGDLSLREAVELANLQPGPNEIRFDPAIITGRNTIRLTQGQIQITDSLAITGPDTAFLPDSAQTRLTIDGGYPLSGRDQLAGDRIFYIDDGDPLRASSVSISGLTLAGGNAVDEFGAGNGGAVYAAEPLMLTTVRIGGSRAVNGGGVYAAAGLKATNVIVLANRALSDGGGVWAAGDVVLVDSRLTSNIADVDGGGAKFASESATKPTNVSVSNVTIRDNRAPRGAGLAWDEFTAISIVNSVIASNQATNTTAALTSGAAGLYGTGPLVLAHSSVVNNQMLSAVNPASVGGMQVALAAISNSIIAGNNGGTRDISVLAGGHVAARYSLIGDNRGSGLAEAPVKSPDAQGNLIGGLTYGLINPQLGPLWIPSSTSPAVNAGTPLASALPPDLSEFDVRNAPFARVFGSRIDMGAYEFQPNQGALNGDFNSSGGPDGFDFLTWQRGFGTTAGAKFAQGDATADGDIDSSDLAVWKTSRFGATTIASAALTADPLPPPAAVDASVIAPANAAVRRQSQFSPPARKLHDASRRHEFAPTPRDAALASTNDDLADDEIESGELHDSDFNIAIWDEALSRY